MGKLKRTSHKTTIMKTKALAIVYDCRR